MAQMTKKEMKEAQKPHPTACCESCGKYAIPVARVDFLSQEGRPIICVRCAQAIEDAEKAKAPEGKAYGRPAQSRRFRITDPRFSKSYLFSA